MRGTELRPRRTIGRLSVLIGPGLSATLILNVLLSVLLNRGYNEEGTRARDRSPAMGLDPRVLLGLNLEEEIHEMVIVR